MPIRIELVKAKWLRHQRENSSNAQLTISRERHRDALATALQELKNAQLRALPDAAGDRRG